MLRFDNTAKGITRLLRHLAKQEATLAVGESTGGTSGLLVSRLRKAEVGVRVANPGRGESLRQGLRPRSQDRPAGCSGAVLLWTGAP